MKSLNPNPLICKLERVKERDLAFSGSCLNYRFTKTGFKTVLPMGQKGSREQLFPGDIVEFPRNKYFSHFAVFYGERDGIPYVAHLTCRDSDSKHVLYGRAMRSAVRLDPLELMGKRYKVNNMLDGAFPARDFHTVVKELIDDALGKDVTFDILFNNSEHQATQLRYGVKRSQQIETIYEHIMPAWKKLFKHNSL
ncbi:unnamed protein product [Gadus morhua 'NCC']